MRSVTSYFKQIKNHPGHSQLKEAGKSWLSDDCSYEQSQLSTYGSLK